MSSSSSAAYHSRQQPSSNPPTMAAPKNAPGDAKAAAAKMHRRSRSGCFTCRLRRKKCEEGKPACKACKHLGLRCDYKRPMWWGNSEQRREQKEIIKNIIKRTQLSKKSAPTQAAPPSSQPPQPPPHLSTTSTPPSLSHSVPNSAEAPFADTFAPSRCPSEESPYSGPPGFINASPNIYDMPPPQQPPAYAPYPHYPAFSPYEIDIKTEHEIFVNNVATRKDSTISTFSTFQPPAMQSGMSGFPLDSWVQREQYESMSEEFAEEPVDFNVFQFPHGPATPGHETVITVDDGDQYLLSHFLDKVLKLIFPILDVNQHGSARADVILPALESNRAYLHCCLSTAATHMKATEGLANEQLDSDIVRHRYAAISELCEALGKDTNHAQILEATLSMIFFQCSVGRPTDTLPDIPWHQHFQAAASLVNKLDLPAAAAAQTSPSFNMTLTAWIDILGSTIMGRSPMFADTYRELNMANGSAGLAELMGCDDKIMFLISEIACLDVQSEQGINEVVLCRYVESLAKEIGETEAMAGQVDSCISPSGAIRPKQLNTNITAVFRLAARIYLCTLVPGYTPTQPSMCHLLSQFADLMEYIPAGMDGFDKSLAWPLLIAGAASTAQSPFRGMLEGRCQRLGDAANFGSFGRIRELLKDIWQINDAAVAQGGEYQGVRWRDVMQQKGWDFLLI